MNHQVNSNIPMCVRMGEVGWGCTISYTKMIKSKINSPWRLKYCQSGFLEVPAPGMSYHTKRGGCEKDDLLREGGSQSIYTGPGLGLDPTGILLHPSPSRKKTKSTLACPLAYPPPILSSVLLLASSSAVCTRAAGAGIASHRPWRSHILEIAPWRHGR